LPFDVLLSMLCLLPTNGLYELHIVKIEVGQLINSGLKYGGKSRRCGVDVYVNKQWPCGM